MVTVLLILIVVLVAGLAAAYLLPWLDARTFRERQRILAEAQFADWQLQQITRAALRRMLDEARRHQS